MAYHADTEPGHGEPGPAACDAIIVNYNAGPSLMRAVQSVLAQGVGRVIVVDNASLDDSLRPIRSLAIGGRTSIVAVGENVGFAAACNIGIRESRAAYLLFLNPDCTLQPGALQRLLNVLQSGHRIGMVGGRLSNPDGTEQRGSRRRFPTLANTLRVAWGAAGRSRMLQHEDPLPPGPVQVDAVSGACMLVKREAIREVGPWDAGYFLHCEDLDWCRQFAAHHWQVVFVPDAVVSHEQGVSSRTRPMMVEWHKHRGMLRYYRKWLRRERGVAITALVTLGVGVRFGAVAVRLLLSRVSGRRQPR